MAISKSGLTKVSVAVRDLQIWNRVLRSGQWYSTLPDKLQAALCEIATAHRFQDGHCLFRRGDNTDGIYAILEGAVAISNINGTSQNSRNAVLVVLQPSNWFGEIALFDNGTRTHDAYIRGRSTLLHLSQTRMETMLEAAPSYWRDFGRLLAGKTRLNFQTVEDLMALPARARLASRLLLIIDGYGWRNTTEPAPTSLNLKVSQADLAETLGYTRQTVNLMLQDMQSKGWLSIKRGVIEILALNALKREAQGLN